MMITAFKECSGSQKNLIIPCNWAIDRLDTEFNYEPRLLSSILSYHVLKFFKGFK